MLAVKYFNMVLATHTATLFHFIAAATNSTLVKALIFSADHVGLFSTASDFTKLTGTECIEHDWWWTPNST